MREICEPLTTSKESMERWAHNPMLDVPKVGKNNVFSMQRGRSYICKMPFWSVDERIHRHKLRPLGTPTPFPFKLH